MEQDVAEIGFKRQSTEHNKFPSRVLCGGGGTDCFVTKTGVSPANSDRGAGDLKSPVDQA